MIKERIQSFTTDNKTVIVKIINKKYELTFRKENRLMCTIWLHNYHQIYPIITKFLSTGEVDAVGVWMV
jgi:preprotein translocase subunit SecA